MRLSLLLLLLLTTLAWAKPVRDGHVEVELVAQPGSPVAGQALELGVHFKMDEHWHVYWKNPGATGYPPKFTWHLPKGWTAGEIAWPVPQRLVIADLQQFVYEKEVLLTTRVSVPSDYKGEAVELSADVDWLACSESCIPGKAKVALHLPEAAVPTALFEKAASELPETTGNITLRSWRLGPQKAFLEYPGDAGDKADFFANSSEANFDSAPIWQAGKGLEIPVHEKDERLQGVLAIEQGGQRRGLLIDVAIDGKAPEKPLSSAAPLAPVAAGVSFWSAILGGFLAGMILNLMPCVFPVLSLKALSLVRHNQEGSRAQWMQGWVYTAGVLVSIWAIAAPLLLVTSGTRSLGWGYQMQSPLFVTLLASLFLGIALNLFGLFEVGEGLTRLGSLAEGKEGYSESFWSGIVATVSATPCTGPFMGAVLGYAVTQPAPVAFLVFTVLGLGIAFPYLLLCGVPATRRWLPRPGAWMESFKLAMGFPMLGAMVWFVYILANLLSAEGLGLVMGGLVAMSLGAWIFGRWGYSPESSVRLKGKLAAAVIGLAGVGTAAAVAHSPEYSHTAHVQVAHSENGLTWEPFTPEKLEGYRKEGKPVFIDFTAAWCINCKVNERLTLADASVIQAFQDGKVVTLKADWTQRDETIGKFLATFGRTGVPFYVYYPPNGEPRPLPEAITPAIVKTALIP
ncbi:MAG: thioredoxin family protein [Candidatus Eremiobacteraeota bacterium]|nr:thioredoxin family protein [Candidatus Eremiobacteraeota bacterium]MCW5871360.1 thioredoxin family protein [Candidatus Eremiobacteraeota bacterium]